MPDAEFNEDQNYRDNLLGLLPAGFKGNFRKAEGAINAYAKVLRDAGMDVKPAVRMKDETSVAAIKNFNWLYCDDLSFRYETHLPQETQTIL